MNEPESIPVRNCVPKQRPHEFIENDFAACPICGLHLMEIPVEDCQEISIICPRCQTALLATSELVEVDRGEADKVDGSIRKYLTLVAILVMAIIAVLSLVKCVSHEDSQRFERAQTAQDEFKQETRAKKDSLNKEEEYKQRLGVERYTELNRLRRAAKIFISEKKERTSIQRDKLWESEFKKKNVWCVVTVENVRKATFGGYIVDCKTGDLDLMLYPMNNDQGRKLLDLNVGDKVPIRGVLHMRGMLSNDFTIDDVILDDEKYAH